MQIPIYTTQITEPGTVNFEESEKLRKVKLLRLFSIISLGFYTANWLISLAVIAWTNQSFQPFGIISTLAYFVLCISCYTLAKGKFYHPAIWLLLLISLYPPVLVYLSFGTQLPTIMEFALPVVLSVVLASAFETALVTTFCVVFILSIYVTQDFLKIYTPPLALNQETAFWIGVFITIGVVPTVVAILVIPFRDQLRTVKTQNRSLQELSFTLKSLNDQLIAEIEERRNAEEALKESETRYRTLATSFPNGAVFLYDQNLCCILAEGQELARTRYSKEVLEGHRISEIFPPDIGQILESHCRKTLSGASSSFELAVDGEVYQVFVVPVKDEQGEISAGMVMTQNISKRLKAEQALRESEERLRTVITNAPLVLFALDSDGVCTFSEGLGLEALGYKPAELVGQSILELYKDSPVFYRDIKAALQGQAIENVSEVGSLTFHNWFSPIYDKQNCFDGVIGVSINISEHRAAEKALRKSEAKNRALLNAIPDTILAISQDGYYLDYKPAHDPQLACPPETFLGKNIEEMWLSENAPTAMKLINEVLSTGQPATFEYNLNIKEKELFFEARAAAVSNYSEVLVIVRDITEQKKAESEMQNTLKKGRELGELKNRFISMASHEFRTPLSVILSSSELLEHYYQTFSPEKRQQHFDRIKAAITYMTELLEGILFIGKAEANKLENNPALLNLDQFCYNMVAEIKQGVGSANAIYYRSELEAGKEYLLDEKLLRQILYNLLVNACKYSYPASTISFVASQSHTEDEIEFQVQNEGPGILPEDLPHLFEAFHRGKNTGTIRGNGLGLTIVKTSLDLMGGNITIDSQVGDITTFTVALPAKSSLNLVPL